MQYDSKTSFPPEAIKRQLNRIVAGAAFAGSERMSRFLRFAVECTLAGQADKLKEYAIGVEVFDRRENYDPRVDPIVRVEARRLRSKLDAYYKAEGRTDELVIELPKGSYVPRFRTRATEAPTQEAVAEPVASTIAVLPFTNTNPEDEYFSDGLTEELIHALTKVEDLRVVAWNSAVQLRASSRDVYSIGQQLKVATVLQGTVRRAGDRLRIRVQLVDTTTGYYLWSETFDRGMSDLFVIQEEIAAAIARTLKIRFASPGLARHDLDAYNLYLKGRYELNKRTAAGMRRGIALFQEALGRDENFALAWAGLADSYALLADYGVELPGRSMAQAKTAACRALQIDPTLAEAEASLGLIKSLYDWNWTEAESHYKRAMALNPGYSTAFHWYGTDYLALLGRFNEAAAIIDRALELDPLSLNIRESRSYIAFLTRDYQRAIKISWENIEVDPFFYKCYTMLGRAYIQLGEYGQAIVMLQKGRGLAGGIPNILGALGQAYALNGEEARARRTLEELATLATERYVTSTCFAIVHIGLGEFDAALNWLERGLELHDIPLANMKVHPVYDPLRSYSRFDALLRALRLPEDS